MNTTLLIVDAYTFKQLYLISVKCEVILISHYIKATLACLNCLTKKKKNFFCWVIVGTWKNANGNQIFLDLWYKKFCLVLRKQMGMAARRIVSTSPLLSKWILNGVSSTAQGMQKHSCRHFVSDFAATHLGITLDFQRWHNGGGLVHRSASVDQTVVIDVGAVVNENSQVYSHAYLRSGSIVGASVSIGQFTEIGYNVVLNNCSVGSSCVIHSGVCVGQDGFGFYSDEQGKVIKKPQKLGVKIGNNVEIGANTCIDRGSWRDTTIGDYCKIDNLVQIGHNVIIGSGCMLCGQVGIAGSATIGDCVTLGGRVAVRDHVSITSKVRVAANSCVTKSIIESGDYGGFPAVPIREWRRQVATLHLISKRTTTHD